MTGGPPALNIGASQALAIAKQTAFGTAATVFTSPNCWVEFRTRAIKPVTGRKLYKTGAGVRGDERKRGRSKSNTGGTFSIALQNLQGVPQIAYAWGCDDVTLDTPANATTLNGAVAAGDPSVVVALGTGYATGTGYIQIGPDAAGRSEVHAIGTVTGTTVAFANSETLTRGYATGVAVHNEAAPTLFTHVFSDATAPPYLTIALNRSGQWFQVQDVQFDQLALALSGDDEWVTTFTILGGNGFTEIGAPTPSFATDINELNLADLTAATLLNSVAVSDVAQFSWMLKNGVKQGWGGNSYYPTKQAAGEFSVSGDADLYFDAAAVESMIQSMVAGTEVDAAFTIGHHVLTIKNANFLEPDWTDTLAELNRVKATFTGRSGDSSSWTWTNASVYLSFC